MVKLLEYCTTLRNKFYYDKPLNTVARMCTIIIYRMLIYITLCGLCLTNKWNTFINSQNDIVKASITWWQKKKKLHHQFWLGKNEVVTLMFDTRASTSKTKIKVICHIMKFIFLRASKDITTVNLRQQQALRKKAIQNFQHVISSLRDLRLDLKGICLRLLKV
jgi:hypothetical protein